MIRLQGEISQYYLESSCDDVEEYCDYEPQNPRLDVDRISEFTDLKLCTLLSKLLKHRLYEKDSFTPMMESILKQYANGNALSEKQQRAIAIHIVEQRRNAGSHEPI